MKFSIVIPAYNVEAYVGRAIESIICQTYKDIEVVVVDDGSTDGTFDVIKGYAERDSRVKLIHTDNFGVSHARNRALDNVRGELIAFLDSDDWLAENAVEKLVEFYQTEPDMLLACDFYSVTQNGSAECVESACSVREKVSFTQEKLVSLYGDYRFKLNSACFKVFNAEIIRNMHIRFDEAISHGEDGLFVYTYLQYVKGMNYFPFELWYIFERPGSATQTPYHKKWLTAIEAVDQIVRFKTNSMEVCAGLMEYAVKRITAIEHEALKVKKLPKEDICFMRKRLKEYHKKYTFNKVTSKTLLKGMAYMLAPIWMLKGLVDLQTAYRHRRKSAMVN